MSRPKFKLNLKRKLPTRCKSHCPWCGEECLGALEHIGVVEHQCSKHFWMVGSLKAELVRNFVRSVLALNNQVERIRDEQSEQRGFESGYKAGFEDGRRV